MSVVSGVTILCSLSEGHTEHGSDVALILNGWLPKSPGFFDISDSYAGTKHPQHYVFGAGINYMLEDAFVEKFLAHKWEYPERAILIIQPEDGATRVFRPEEIA